ncbi:MAG: DUF3467 domain-containing protein [Candidatus Aenigmarchaeota archaeon]|nr:DUF3467 domain-containing protein [Candidatus Aenigmarchaeota archaeon]RLI97511.1 MAG: hypothetical protein DRO96_00390 [Candidatus Aenigmarchaeota archaeon]
MVAEKRKLNFGINHGGPAFFSDSATIRFSESKFALDFKQTSPRSDELPDGVHESIMINHNVIIIDPIMAKNLLGVLSELVKKYEKKFGKIKTVGKKKRETHTTKKKDSIKASNYIG